MKKIILSFICVVLFSLQSFANEKILRVAVVNTPGYSGLMKMLASEFKKESGVDLKIHSSSAPHYEATEGRADMVISHYGKSEMEPFIMDGYGYFPKMVFANQSAIIGPKDDPAGIRGLNATEAYKKLANSDAPFVLNYVKTSLFLDEYLFELTGVKEPLSKRDTTVNAKEQTAKAAEKIQGYFFWGAYPFLRYQKKHNTNLEILVLDDPILQRVMASTVVRANKIKGANEELAKKFEEFLIRPSTQAKIAKFRSMGSDKQLWWPYAKHN